jgi:hypothetical protein
MHDFSERRPVGSHRRHCQREPPPSVAHLGQEGVEIADQLVTDRVINELMGKDASARFRFIMERAEDAQELDV